MSEEDRNRESDEQILNPEPCLATLRGGNHVPVMVLVLTFLLVAITPLWAEDVGGQLEVGVAWQGKSMMPERILVGLQKSLAEHAPRIRLEIRKELSDLAALDSAIYDFEGSKRAMVILRSSGAQLLGQRGVSIPAFIGGTNNPVELGAAESLTKPKANITGVTYSLPARLKLEAFRQVYPTMKRFVLLVEEGHPGTPIEVRDTENAASDMSLSGRTVFCKTVDDVLAAVRETDPDQVIILGLQALLMDNASFIIQAASERLFFSYSEQGVEQGSLAGIVVDDYKLGQMLGMMLIDVLVNDKPIAEIPIQTDPEPRLRLNLGAIERFKTEIPLAIRSLAKTEQMLASILKSAPSGIGMVENRVIVQINDYILELTGYSREELIGKSTRMLYPTQEEFNSVGQAKNRQTSGQGTGAVETRWLRKDGSIRHVLLSSTPLDPKDLSLGATFTVFDITDRKQAEADLASRSRWFMIGLAAFIFVLLALVARLVTSLLQRNIAVAALKTQKERSANIVEGTAAGTWEWNVQTGEAIFNERFVGMAGYTLEELSPVSIETWKYLAHPDDLKASEEALAGHLRGEQEMYQIECRIRHKDGHLAWVLDRGKVISWTKDGKPLWMYGSRQNITERKQAEEALQRSEEKYRTILGNIDDAYYEVALNGNLTFFNDSMCQIWGYCKDELLGMNYRQYTDPENAKKLFKAFNGVYTTGKPSKELDWQIIRKDGTKRFIETSISLLKDPSDILAGFRGVVRDITEKKQAEAERLRLEGQLQQAQKMEAVGQLAGGVAHDFNNMLGVILGYTEIALEEVDPSQPLFADLVEIRKAATRSADITRQLLAFARKQTVAPQVLDLNQTVEGMLKMLRRLIGENINLIWMPGTGLWSIKMDPSQVDQTLANLCVNARDAIAGVGNVTVETENTLLDEVFCAGHPGAVPGEYVRIAVSDTGRGMDKETLAHIFEPFFTTKGVGEGTGLGLATVYGVVKQNNGFIIAYSEPGQGSTFTIYIPRHIAKIALTQATKSTESVLCGNEIILLVEDEPTLLSMSKRQLERLGYTVLAASTPREAIRIVSEFSGQIHLLATDVIMPEMNGHELAEQLVESRPEMKHLFMSGYTANIIASQGVLKEGVTFIQKPFSKNELAAKVREALES